MRPKKSFALLWILILLLGLVSSGCSPVLKSGQDASDKTILLTSGHTIGQTFVASERGLSGIDILVAPAADTVLELFLYTDARKEELLTSAKLPLLAEDGAVYQRFTFPALTGSARTYYYFEIQVESGPGVAISASNGESALDGAMYQDQEPQDMQLAYRLAYDPPALLFGLAGEALQWIWFLLLAGWLFLLPGWALLRLSLCSLWAKWGWAEKTALAAGAGLALYPALLLWLHLMHLRLGNVLSWALPAASLVYLVWAGRGHFANLPKIRLRQKPGSLAFDLVFIAIVGMIFFARFWVIRGADAPLWGDSYQHTMIAQLIVENRGLFDSWLPYEPYASLTVQYGFSSGVAAWMWLTGMTAPQATLVFGQILNGLAILTLYPLAVRLGNGNRWTGVSALVVGGLLSSMPGFYVNWGRYAQLMGQAILPAALLLVWAWLEDTHRRWGQAVLHGLLLAGLLLSYYRMAFFYAAFFPTLLLLAYVHGPFGRDWRKWRTALVNLVIVAASALLLLFPWIVNVQGSHLSDSVEAGVTQGSPVQAVLSQYSDWVYIRSYVPVGILALSAAALLISLARRRLEVVGVLLWLFLVNAVRAGSLIHLPGANMMQVFAVMISLYIFASLVAGWVLGFLFDWFSRRVARAGVSLILAVILLLALYGLNVQRKIFNPRTYAIVTRSDMRAMDWIRSNIAEDAVFLVEGFRIYQGTTAVGSDGGWWLSLLTGRRSTMPPQYALLNERPTQPDYSDKVVELVETLEKHFPTDPSVQEEICQRGITHVYVGQLQGKASLEKIQLFPAELDTQTGYLKLIYAQDRVKIYEFSRDFCGRSASQ